MTARVVIVHAEHGVYLGHAKGLGFFSLLDTAGQPAAATFDTEQQAKDHVRSWNGAHDPEIYRYVAVEVRGTIFADPMALTAAGLEREAAPLIPNELALRTEPLQ